MIDSIVLGVVIYGYIRLIIALWKETSHMHYCRRCNASATRRGDVVQEDSQAYECSKCLQYHKEDRVEIPPTPSALPKKNKRKSLWQ